MTRLRAYSVLRSKEDWTEDEVCVLRAKEAQIVM